MNPARTICQLSNLIVGSNLLPEDYPAQLSRVSAGDLHDIKERNPSLHISFASPDYLGLTSDQVEEWRQHLFWGDRRVRLNSDDRFARWLQLAVLPPSSVDEVLPSLEEEGVFELLVVATLLCRVQPDQAGCAPQVVVH